ncbi:NADH dehydrogenase subunit 4L (mitochondrion) [Xenopus laevis]|uniref:NADH-ubiquinone oxidoreductase chain 4L n=1 Tax=Xenopus laevis TaxID=8355 RepID=NU4LM_XENLA|nr:NADH dehydrogenase subunit 4L [Xenopus laevis]P03904.1 RecName: Full=NADH-ubiquinone oxidoreductase chain 4L; AltName: Full=NADH dehydrogenase subunit 4L [Xenopus laevis]AAA66466.1 ORF 4L [Xenopus laevis]
MTLIHFSFCSAFILGLTGLALNRSPILSILLCLEGMLLMSMDGIVLTPLHLTIYLSSMMLYIMLPFAAPEAATGLSLNSDHYTTHGTDKLFSLNLLEC